MSTTRAQTDSAHAATGAFDSVLIANRGEIACRVIRTVQAMGLRAVAVYSDADVHAPHVGLADEAVRLGPAPAAESYLNAEKILAAARLAGVGAIHPGYGFLSENAAFAQRCEEEGAVFIGPPARSIELMGDKITARATVESRGVPTVPGISRPGLKDEEILDAAPGIGFPVLIKPSAGGGGKGMHRVERIEDLAGALVTARREAASSFGDDSLFVEHFVDTPRHIEVQVLADSHGNVIHLGERECSLQRRHQKVIEEAPSALLDEATREEIGRAACDAARAAGYCGAGTVEFIVSAKQPEEFFFMEMNTRLQVEHPVTELVTGVDLVECQVRVALGEELPLGQEDVQLSGHAVEARVYAEDPAAGFLPTGGLIKDIHWPQGRGIRVDAGVQPGQEIGSDYDPMLAKIISWAPSRTSALERLDSALGQAVLEGLATNIDFNRFLVTHPEVIAGRLDTGLLDRIVDSYAPPEISPEVYAVGALGRIMALQRRARVAGDAAVPGATQALGSSWLQGDSWRGAAAPAPVTYSLCSDAGREPRLVTLTEDFAAEGMNPGERHWQVQIEPVLLGAADAADSAGGQDGGEPEAAHSLRLGLLTTPGHLGAGAEQDFKVRIDGGPAQPWRMAGEQVFGPAGAATLVEFCGTAEDMQAQAADTAITSPMPGTIIAVEVPNGADVTAGQAVVVMEAMKMEHTLTAACDGAVRINVSVGDKVGTGDVLADVTPREEQGTH